MTDAIEKLPEEAKVGMSDMGLTQWLFASIDEIIDCDFINIQEEKTEEAMPELYKCFSGNHIYNNAFKENKQ